MTTFQVLKQVAFKSPNDRDRIAHLSRSQNPRKSLKKVSSPAIPRPEIIPSRK